MFSPCRLLLISLAVGLTPGLRADTLIVDVKSASAADTNPGTRARPFKTIGAAARAVHPGDTVLVRPGLYREAVELTVSGTQTQPITFQSETPGAAVIDGADVVTDWRSEGVGVWSFPAPDLTPNQYNDRFGSYGQWVYLNGRPLEIAKTRDGLSPGAFWFDFNAKRIFVAPNEGQDVHAQTVEYAHRDGLIAPPHRDINTVLPLDDIHVLGFTLQHNADWFQGRRAIDGRGRRWLIQGNHVRWSSWGGITVERTRGSVIRDNVVEWCGDTGIGCRNCEDLLVEGNKVSHCNWTRQDPGSDGGFGKFVLNLDGRIQNNESFYQYGYGPWYDIHNVGNILQGNVSHDSIGGAGLMSEISDDNTFLDNVAYNIEGDGILIAESPGCVVERNVTFNCGTGLKVRGNYTRRNDHESDAGVNSPGYYSPGREGFRQGLQDIPDHDPTRLDEYMAKYDLYWVAPKAYLSNNDLFRENLSFDNGADYGEDRDEFHPSSIAPFVSAFSDFNAFYNAQPTHVFSAGEDGDLARWQAATGRDAHSVFADPRDPKTKLPDWAIAKKALWGQTFRSFIDTLAQNYGLIKSPSAAETYARLVRSRSITPVPIGDTQVKAFLFEVDGVRTLGLWTTQVAARRPVRLRLGLPSIVVEDAYDLQTPTKLAGGIVSLTATYLPTYLRGVGRAIADAQNVTLTPQSFNPPGQDVPATATFRNDTPRPQALTAEFSGGRGYTAQPGRLTRTLAPGEKASVTIQLKPDGTAGIGPSQARMTGTLGGEDVTRVAAFSVGEGGGLIPRAALGRTPLAVISDASQFASGDKAAWKGPADLSGRVYAAWTPDTLTLAVDVTDDAVLPAAQGGAPWDSDAVEFFVDGRDPAFQYSAAPTEGCYQIGISPADPPAVRVLSKTPLKGLETSATRTAGGYRVQIRVPLTAANFPALGFRPGRPLKIAVLLDDKDDPKAETRKDVFGWGVSPGGANYGDTSGWKTLTLGP